jgi:hypothetical protein
MCRMFKPLTVAAAVVLVLGLAACGDEAPAAGTGSTSAAAADGKDTLEGCRAAVVKMLEEAADEASTPPAIEDDKPPAECDDLPTEQQQAVFQEAVEAALKEIGDLDKELEKLITPTP